MQKQASHEDGKPLTKRYLLKTCKYVPKISQNVGRHAVSPPMGSRALGAASCSLFHAIHLVTTHPPAHALRPVGPVLTSGGGDSPQTFERCQSDL